WRVPHPDPKIRGVFTKSLSEIFSLPSPACGRGAGVREKACRSKLPTMSTSFSEHPGIPAPFLRWAPSPLPLSRQAGEGERKAHFDKKISDRLLEPVHKLTARPKGAGERCS